MELEKISRLCKRFSLDERDGLMIRIRQKDYEKGKERMDLSLVGQVIANKLANRDAL